MTWCGVMLRENVFVFVFVSVFFVVLCCVVLCCVVCVCCVRVCVCVRFIDGDSSARIDQKKMPFFLKKGIFF